MFEMSNIHRMFIFWNEIPKKKTLNFQVSTIPYLKLFTICPKGGKKKSMIEYLQPFLLGCLPKGPYSYLHWH